MWKNFNFVRLRKQNSFFIIALQFQAYAKSTRTTLRSQLSQKGDGSERKF